MHSSHSLPLVQVFEDRICVPSNGDSSTLLLHRERVKIMTIVIYLTTLICHCQLCVFSPPHICVFTGVIVRSSDIATPTIFVFLYMSILDRLFANRTVHMTCWVILYPKSVFTLFTHSSVYVSSVLLANVCLNCISHYNQTIADCKACQHFYSGFGKKISLLKKCVVNLKCSVETMN